jgi:hypothetical protein
MELVWAGLVTLLIMGYFWNVEKSTKREKGRVVSPETKKEAEDKVADILTRLKKKREDKDG